jgi:hypothetical protein
MIDVEKLKFEEERREAMGDLCVLLANANKAVEPACATHREGYPIALATTEYADARHELRLLWRGIGEFFAEFESELPLATTKNASRVGTGDAKSENPLAEAARERGWLPQKNRYLHE